MSDWRNDLDRLDEAERRIEAAQREIRGHQLFECVAVTTFVAGFLMLAFSIFVRVMRARGRM
jgi:hypothetical protein